MEELRGLKLDVGCGNRKLGDINVDIDKHVKPDIVCDIHHLPFKDKIFSTVFNYHTLEHKGVKPVKAIKELLRVSKGTVEIQVPHWLSPNAKKDKNHVNFQIMRRKFWLPFKPSSITLDYVRLVPFFPIPLRPNNITVTLKETERFKELYRR